MEDRRAFLAVALASLLFLGTLRTLLGSIYFLNLETLELNWTAGYSLLLLSPIFLALPVVARRMRATLAVAALLLGVGAVAGALAGSAGSVIALAGLGCAAFLVLLPLIALTSRSVPVAAGIAAAFAFDAARLAAGNSVEPLTGGLHVAVLALVALALAAITMAPLARDAVSPTQTGARAAMIAGPGLASWLFLEIVVLGSVHHVARWNETSIPLVLGAIVVGLVGGIVLVLRYATRPPRARVLIPIQLAPLLVVLDHALLHSPFLPLFLAAAQVVLVIDLAVLLRVLSRATRRSAGIGLFAGMAVFVALTFAFVFTFTFAFVPFGDLFEDRAALVLMAAILVLIAASGWAMLRTPLAARRAFPRHAAERRIVAILLVLPLLVGLVAATTPGVTVVAPEGRDLRVLSYNLHQGFNNNGVLDADVFVRVVQDIDADLVSLQESDTTRITSGNMDLVAVLAHRLGYHPYYGQPTSAQSFGVAILSKRPIEETFLRQLPSDADNRYLVAARIDVDGTSVWFHAIHMGLANHNRAAQLDEILRQAAQLGGPSILAGDFNSCPDGLCPRYGGAADTVYEQVTARYQDTWTAAGHARDDPAGYTYDAVEPSRRIDHIFASDEFTVQAARVERSADALAASDHLPVIAELTLRE